MQALSISNQKRIESIDILRGLVMIIMALDHAREYFHVSANVFNPLDLTQTTPTLFFTRWVTHFCAPIFVFLSGISVYLQSLRKTKKELSAFLIKRGLWLIMLELIVVSFAWSYNPSYEYVFLQVIWVIGLSMVLLGLAIHLPFNVILIIGLAITLGHNLLDVREAATGFKHSFWMDLLHSARFTAHSYTPGHAILIAYPFLPWVGLMFLGYCTGIYFSPTRTSTERKKFLITTGVGLLALFVVLRFINQYGNPVPWTTQKNPLYTFLSFINIHKYPPSLFYVCVTIGIALLFLAMIENVQNKFTNILRTYGRVAFFYYILHIYIFHTISAIAFLARGHSLHDATKTGSLFPFYFLAPGEGYGLPIVYLAWIAVVALLYPLCKWYDKYKTNHKEKWWLSYL